MQAGGKQPLKMNSPEVKKASANVNVSTTVRSPSRDYPDEDMLANKYGVSQDNGEGSSRSDQGLSLQQQMEFMQKQQQLVQQLQGKNQEINNLCTLLEAVEPMPGMDPMKYKRVIDNPDADLVDFRDAKIVDLAKKSRKLQMLLTKERSNNDAKEGKIIELQQTVEKLRRELESTIPSQENNRTHQMSTNSLNEMDETTAKEVAAATGNLTREVALGSRKLEDMRRKLEHIEEQNKVLSRALIKEVGDGASLEDAVDEGRKGRAQQIVILKSKVKRLENMLESGGMSLAGGSTIASGITGATGTRTSMSRKTNVDTQAEEELEYMSSVRKVAVDELSEAHQKLSDEYNALASKHQGAKARVRTLEAESQQHRQQIKFVIGKTETDDKLISALKSEIVRLKELAQKTAMERRGDAVETRIERASKQAASVATKQQESELNRLRRLAKQQAEQLATQDQVIKELRGRGKNY